MCYQYRSLCDGMFDLVLLYEVFLLESLDGVDLLRVLFLAEHNFAIGACANHLDQLKVVDVQAAVRDL